LFSFRKHPKNFVKTVKVKNMQPEQEGLVLLPTHTPVPVIIPTLC
jgi:hypothetical protein